MRRPLETEIVLRGASALSAKVSTLADPDIHAHNSFSHPDAVQVRTESIETPGARFTHRFPAASVNRVVLELARDVTFHRIDVGEYRVILPGRR